MAEGRFPAAADAVFDALRMNERELGKHETERDTLASVVRMHDEEIERLRTLISEQRDLLVAIDPRCEPDGAIDDLLVRARQMFAVGIPPRDA